MLATSLTWRVLAFSRTQSDEPLHDKLDSWSVTDEAEQAWRETLLENRPNPGIHQQHLVRFDYVTSAAHKPPQNLNSYLMRSFDFDLMSNGEDIYVYMKLAQFMFIGFVKCKAPERWKGSKLGFGGGVIGDQNIPGFVYEDIIIPKAGLGHRAASGMSVRQKKKVIERIRKDQKRAGSSGTYRAIRQDQFLRDS